MLMGGSERNFGDCDSEVTKALDRRILSQITSTLHKEVGGSDQGLVGSRDASASTKDTEDDRQQETGGLRGDNDP